MYHKVASKVREIYRRENNKGYGFDPEGGNDINNLRGTGTLIRPARGRDEIAVYDYGDTYILVGDSHGPWAVQVSKNEINFDIKNASGDNVDLKNELIRLGHQKPELRDHLRPILDVVTKVSSSVAHFKVYDKGEYVGDDYEIESKLEDLGFYPDKVYSYGTDMIVIFRGPDAYDEAAEAVGAMARHYQVSKAFIGGH